MFVLSISLSNTRKGDFGLFAVFFFKPNASPKPTQYNTANTQSTLRGLNFSESLKSFSYCCNQFFIITCPTIFIGDELRVPMRNCAMQRKCEFDDSSI